jgi:hypothetical protein
VKETTTKKPRTQFAAIPAYFDPGDDWSRLVASHPLVAMAILNLADGPGLAPDQAVADQVGVAQATGTEVLGYVDTANGARPIADVVDDIARYDEWYATCGVFLDQGHVSGPVIRSYYHPLYASIKAEMPTCRVVLNAGAAMPRVVMVAADIFVNFEGNYLSYLDWSPSPWTGRYSPSRFWHIVYGIPTPEAMDLVVTLSRGRRAGWLYATDQDEHDKSDDGHLYDRLPSPLHWVRLLRGLPGSFTAKKVQP